jgi:hypothetical protein
MSIVLTSTPSEHEWHFSAPSQEKMVKTFPHLLSENARLDFEEDRNAWLVIQEMKALAQSAKKCREIHSDANLMTGMRRKFGVDCRFYMVKDVLFVTIPCHVEGQKLVVTIYSLSEKLAERARRRFDRSNTRTAKRTQRAFKGGEVIYRYR